MVVNRTIFRQQALKHYQQIQDLTAVTAIKDGDAAIASYQTGTLAIWELLVEAIAGQGVS
jgi:hypothetical protein